jgi:flavin reductase (DIM6/NTAB) family NADH-FMN oxidoreductase RutF/DNA-binding IclR family transcriptional regulator
LKQTEAEIREAGNPKWFRQVLAQYPTGVCVVTASPPNQRPAGMAVGSFTSVSLNPPLVAFFPDRSSTSWPKIQSAGRFCVNILGSEQEPVCRRFSSKAADKFEGLGYRLSALGSPIIDEAVAWIDCELQSVQEAGDHFIVVGLVRDLQIESSGLPLLFFQGGYGRFSPLSLSAPDPLGAISEQLRYAEMARPEMEQMAAELSARCIATARVDDEIVVAASAGSSNRNSVATLVGQRLPYIPPTGSVFAAWCSTAEVEEWLAETAEPARSRFRAALDIVRARGFQLGLLSEAQRAFASTLDRLAQAPVARRDVVLREMVQKLSYDPAELSAEVLHDVRLISVPVFGAKGEVALALTLYEFPKPPGGSGVRPYIDRALEGAQRVTERIAQGRGASPH